MQLKVEKYEVNNPLLKKLIKYFWAINCENAIFNHKILPQKNIDLIFNLSSDVKYINKDNSERKLQEIYFNGITDNFKYRWANQNGRLDMIGISFYPTGLYPFLGIPISEFRNSVIDLNSLYSKFSDELIDKVKDSESNFDKIAIIEDYLIRIIDLKHFLTPRERQMFNNFDKSINQLSIEQFSEKYGIHKRQLERQFNKHIGINPKSYLRISRFQNTMKQILSSKFDLLTDLAFDNGYYDQTHFIKEFKTFTGSLPSQFINHNSSVKEIVRY